MGCCHPDNSRQAEELERAVNERGRDEILLVVKMTILLITIIILVLFL
ncbi:hypothetical protein [Halobacillus litoralis]|nr:hypothetical protein [Halobacillus litoralis]